MHNILIASLSADPMSYLVFSVIVGIMCLIEFIRSARIAITLKKTPYHKIENVAWNLLIANIILLGLLVIRLFTEALSLKEICSIEILSILILRIFPPIIYVYIVNIINSYIIENGCIGFLSKKHKKMKNEE